MRKIILNIILMLCVVNVLHAQMLTTTATGLSTYQRAIHQSQVLYNGKVLIFGGNNFNYLSLVVHNSSELYDPQTNSWTVAAPMNHARVDFASVVLNNGDVMAIGGPDASCEVYNVQNNTWTDVASMHVARNNHCAIKLLNGMVLVAGPNNTSELYNSATNSWSFTGNMQNSRGDGMTLTLLNDGNVLAMGGQNSAKTAEIYDPKTGTWRLLANTSMFDRYDHSSVLLANGKVLLVGSGNTYWGHTTELFNPATETFSNTSSFMSEKRSSDPAILLDDNRVLVFDLGAILTPTDTKTFEIFNPTTNTWSHDAYTSIGATLYSINKLDNGKVLIAGGTFTTGNGAINGGLTVSVNGLTNGITKTYSVNVDNASPCYGKDVVLTLPSSQTGVSYTAYNNSTIVSNTATGGGIVTLTIPFNKLSPGKNIIKVKGSLTGCYSEYLTQLITINTSIQNNAIPILSVGDSAICQGSSITIHATSTESILWSDNTTGVNLTTNKASSYYAQSRDVNGCLSLPSDKAVISILPSAATINAGQDLTICTVGGIIDLGGTPAGGTWTGVGVENKHFFNPAVSNTGTFVVQYNYCGANDTKQITVKESPHVPDFSMSILKDSICDKWPTNTINITNTNPAVNYSLYKNNVLIQTYTNNTSFQYTVPNSSIVTTSVFSVKAYYPECSVDTLVKKDTLYLMPLPINSLVNKFVKDTVCQGDPHIIYILNPQIGISYVAYYASTGILSDTVLCDRAMDTLFITVKPVAWNYSDLNLYAINSLGCKNTLNGTLHPKWVTVNVDFNLNYDSQTVNDTLTATNISNSTSYVWNYAPGINTLVEAANLSKFTAPTDGIYDVTLTGTSRFGCIKSKTKNVTFFNQNTTQANIDICHANTMADATNTKIIPENIITHHVDKDGFTYISYYKGGHTNHINMYISKIAPDGSSVWTIEQTQNSAPQDRSIDHYAAYCNAIQTDSIGNVYVTGSFRGYTMKFNGVVVGKYVSQYNGEYTRFYCIKFDAAGKLIWWVGSEDDGTNVGVDIKYVDDNNIYLSIYELGNKTHFTNGYFNIGGYDSGGAQLIKINSKGEFIEQYATSVLNYDRLFTLFVPPYYPYYGAHKTALGPKIKVTNKSIHVLGRCTPGYIINSTPLTSDSTIIYYDHTLDLATKTWKNPVKIFETKANEEMPLKYEFDSINNYYYLIAYNSIYKIDTLGTRLWSYKFEPSLQVKDFIINNDTILVQGWYKDYFIIKNGSTFDGINNENKEDVFLAKLDVNGNYIGIDHFGSTGKDVPLALLKTNKNEIISIGTTVNNISYNDSPLLNAAVDGYYVRGKLNGTCLNSDYTQLKITSPDNKSIYCASTTVPITWYSLQADSLHMYYRRTNANQYTPINHTLNPTDRLYNWTVPDSILGDSVYFKLSNGSTLSDSILLRVLPLESEKTIIDTLLCKGLPVFYDFGNTYEAYSWKSGGTASSKSFISPAMDTVTVTNAIGCSGKRYFNIKEQKHKLIVNIINSSMQSTSSGISLYKIVNSAPVLVMTSTYNSKHVLSVDTGSYYIRANTGLAPSYYLTNNYSVFVMADAGMVPIVGCTDSTTISLVSMNRISNPTSNTFYGYYFSGSCSSGIPIANVTVYMVNNYGSVLESTKTNGMGYFTFTYFSNVGDNNLVFDDYPIKYKKYPIIANTFSTTSVFFKKNNVIYDCNLVDNIEPETNDRFKCVSPVSDELTVEFSSSHDKVTISLLSVQGAFVKDIYNGSVEENKAYTITKSIQELPAGVYLCTFNDGENYYIKKIIVTR